MAPGASHGQGQPSRARSLHPIDHRFHEPFLHDPSPFPIESMVAVEPGGHDLILRRIGQHVPGQLLDGELVKGQVSVVGSDQPFPPQPHVPAPVALKPVAVRITGQVQPLQSHPLPEMGRSEQTVQGLFVGFGELSLAKASISSSVGGKPVRSRLARLSKVSLSASFFMLNPSAFNRVVRKASTGCLASGWTGTSGRCGVMKAQWP